MQSIIKKNNKRNTGVFLLHPSSAAPSFTFLTPPPVPSCSVPVTGSSSCFQPLNRLSLVHEAKSMRHSRWLIFTVLFLPVLDFSLHHSPLTIHPPLSHPVFNTCSTCSTINLPMVSRSTLFVSVPRVTHAGHLFGRFRSELSSLAVNWSNIKTSVRLLSICGT